MVATARSIEEGKPVEFETKQDASGNFHASAVVTIEDDKISRRGVNLSSSALFALCFVALAGATLDYMYKTVAVPLGQDGVRIKNPVIFKGSPSVSENTLGEGLHYFIPENDQIIFVPKKIQSNIKVDHIFSVDNQEIKANIFVDLNVTDPIKVVSNIEGDIKVGIEKDLNKIMSDIFSDLSRSTNTGDTFSLPIFKEVIEEALEKVLADYGNKIGTEVASLSVLSSGSNGKIYKLNYTVNNNETNYKTEIKGANPTPRSNATQEDVVNGVNLQFRNPITGDPYDITLGNRKKTTTEQK